MKLNWKRSLAALFGAMALLAGPVQAQNIVLTGCSPSCNAPAACDQGEAAPDIDTSAVASDFGSSAGPDSIAPHMIGDVLVKLGTFSQVGPAAGTRSYKIAENQSALPVDRFFYNYSYFDNVGAVGTGGSTDLARHTFGREWLLGDGNSSFQVRVPVWYAHRTIGSTFGDGTADRGAFGDLGFTFKHALINQGGDVFSVGGGYIAPTGPTNIAGVPDAGNTSTLQHDGVIQTFIAGIRQLGRGVFIQGFAEFDIPIDNTDAVLFFGDIQVGYIAYTGSGSGVTALIPSFELHTNNPVGNRVLESGDIYLDTVNATTGLTTVFNNRTMMTTALVAPIGDTRVFDYELQFQINILGGILGGY